MMRLPSLRKISNFLHAHGTKEKSAKTFRVLNIRSAQESPDKDDLLAATEPSLAKDGPVLGESGLVPLTANEGGANAQANSLLCQMPAELFELILEYASDADIICLFLTCKSLYQYGSQKYVFQPASTEQRSTRGELLNRLSQGDSIWQACTGCPKMHKLVPEDGDRNTTFNVSSSFLTCDKQMTATTICRRHRQSITTWQKNLVVRGRDYQGIPRLPISVLEHDCQQFELASSSKDLDREDGLLVKSFGAVQRGFLLLKLVYCAQINMYDRWLERERALRETFGAIPVCRRLSLAVLILSLCQIDHQDPTLDEDHHIDQAKCNSTEFGCARLQRCECCRAEVQIKGVELRDKKYVIQFVVFKLVQQIPGTLITNASNYNMDFYRRLSRGCDSCGQAMETQPNSLPLHMTLRDLFDGYESPRFQSDVRILKV